MYTYGRTFIPSIYSPRLCVPIIRASVPRIHSRASVPRIHSPMDFVSGGLWFLLQWDLTERSERCASSPMIAGSNPSGGSELTFRFDLLLTAIGSSK
jgi:hypothetical protein